MVPINGRGIMIYKIVFVMHENDNTSGPTDPHVVSKDAYEAVLQLINESENNVSKDVES